MDPWKQGKDIRRIQRSKRTSWWNIEEDEFEAYSRKTAINTQKDSSTPDDESIRTDKSDKKWMLDNSKIRTIEQIVINNVVQRAPYFSPYPKKYHKRDNLYIWDFSLKYYASLEEFNARDEECNFQSMNPREIYQTDKYQVFEFDGDNTDHRDYLNRLCLLSKLFIEHKYKVINPTSLYFYCLYKNNESNTKLAFWGYFSKSKRFFTDKKCWENLSWILTLPQYKGKGYGNFLISLSYKLSLDDKKAGSPERPISKPGFKIYKAWWMTTILSYLQESGAGDTTSYLDIQKHTGILDIDTQMIVNVMKINENSEVTYFYLS